MTTHDAAAGTGRLRVAPGEYDTGWHDPWGERGSGEPAGGVPALAEIDTGEVTRIRSRYPFVEVRRAGAGAAMPRSVPKPTQPVAPARHARVLPASAS